MSLADELNKLTEANNNDNNFEKPDYPASHLKHYPMLVNKQNPQVHVRILPSVGDSAPTWAPYRELWVTDNNGKRHLYMLDSNTNSTEDPLMQAVNRWHNAKFTDDKGEELNGLYKLEPRYGAYPSLRYYINVVPLDKVKDKNGVPKYKEHYTQDGKLDVYMLSINLSLLNILGTQLQDDMLNPNTIHLDAIKALNTKGYSFTQEDIENSFISSAFAYPITINYINNNNKVERTLSVDSNDAHMLNPLPKDWRDQVEDLVYQTTPSYKYNPHWVSNLINQYDAELGLTSHVEPPKQSVQQSSQDLQDPFASKAVEVNTPNPIQSQSVAPNTESQDQSTPESEVQQSGGTNVMDTFPGLKDIGTTKTTASTAPTEDNLDNILDGIDLSGLDEDEKNLL